jgi:integrase
MPVLKLTKRAIDDLPSPAKATLYFDTDLAGFGICIRPTGARSWFIEYRPDGGGRSIGKKRLTLGSSRNLTPDQARAAAARLLAGVRLGSNPARERADRKAVLTISALIDAFVAEHVETKLKVRTGESHVAALERLRSAHGTQKADAVTRANLATLHSKMRATPYAANRALAVWRKLFSWAGARGLTPDGYNPARNIERYREQGRERFLTSEELGRLGDALREAEGDGIPWEVDEAAPNSKHLPCRENRRTQLDPFAVAAIRLLILTGARLREILNLRWDAIDTERGVAFLADSKTGRKPLILSAPALAIIAGLPQIDDNPHVIAGAKEGAARADLKRPWDVVCKRAGLTGLRIHDLRHSFASIGAGASLGLPIIGIRGSDQVRDGRRRNGVRCGRCVQHRG